MTRSSAEPIRPGIDRPPSARFADKRAAIVAAATRLVNRHGVAGTTFGDVAAMVGLNTTGATYYFKRKEHLAEAVFADTLSRMAAIAATAAREPDPERRVAEYLRRHFDLRAETLRDRGTPIVTLSEIRALEDKAREPLERQYRSVFRMVRGFFGTPRDEAHKALLTARAFMLEETIFWLPTWLPHYAIADFGRVRARLFDILAHGLARPGTPWAPRPLDTIDDPAADGDSGRTSFLRAATRLINQRGYRGASVERIAAELGVTKGSFYHHLEAKDELVLACFRRSFTRIAAVQAHADAIGGDHWGTLAAAIAALVDLQFSGDWPLLRAAALPMLPDAMRAEVFERSNRIALRTAGSIVDGIAEGSIRPIDPAIASQLVVATVNAAYDLRGWAARLPRGEAVPLYASTLATGLFDDLPGRALATPRRGH